jgi:hypothetical protein
VEVKRRFDTAIPGCCGLSAAQGLTAFDLQGGGQAAVTITERLP